MIFISELQKETLLLLNDLIDNNFSHDDIITILLKNNYDFIKEIKNGYMSKTKTKLYKNEENSFVTLIKKRNGLADWETIKLS